MKLIELSKNGTTHKGKYFAQVGDSPSTVKQKQHARETAIEALKYQAGPGARFIREFKPQIEFGKEEKPKSDYQDILSTEDCVIDALDKLDK